MEGLHKLESTKGCENCYLGTYKFLSKYPEEPFEQAIYSSILRGYLSEHYEKDAVANRYVKGVPFSIEDK